MFVPKVDPTPRGDGPQNLRRRESTPAAERRLGQGIKELMFQYSDTPKMKGPYSIV